MSEKEYASELSKRIYDEQINLLYAVPLSRPVLNLISLTIFMLIIIDYVNHFYAYTWAILLFGMRTPIVFWLVIATLGTSFVALKTIV